MIKCNIITRIKQFELYKCKKSLKHKISLQQNEGIQGNIVYETTKQKFLFHKKQKKERVI